MALDTFNKRSRPLIFRKLAEQQFDLLVIGGGITGASALDPENLLLGSAFQTSFDAIRRPPDTLWLSTEAVAKFIDAKATTTNAPL